MFNKSALLLAVTLAVSVAAGPAPTAPTKRGTAIPIAKRSSLTREDGVFDHDKAIASTIFTLNKHRANLINLEKNKGLDAFHQGAEIKALKTVPVDVEARMQQRAVKRQSETLTDEEDDLEWAGTISVGTPAQKFLIDFDSTFLWLPGSSDLWIPSSSCTSSTCSSKSKYKATSSSTGVKKSGTFSIEYGDQSTVSGPIYTDTVTVAKIPVTKQYFSPVTTLSASFADDPIDGILGLAFPAISNLNQNPFFVNADAGGVVDANQFSFYLASSGSELYLGGTNDDLYTGDIEYNSVDSSGGFWQATGGKALVGSTTAVSGIETIIDSGTTLIYGPPADVKKIFAKVTGSEGYYSYPCATPPTISFNWGGQNWAISAANLNLGQTATGSKDCDLGLGSNVFLLGDAEAVGFAELA
ncbi:acid protease [Mycena olivaceomarginata]|nr:acid protease [Mycena olivaceomarginata]